MRALSSFLVTGGAGFIGARFASMLAERIGRKGRIVIIDSLTYAGSMDRLGELLGSKAVDARFVRADIRDGAAIRALIKDYSINSIVNFAAESHVDRSIDEPEGFVSTNVLGTSTLLDAARDAWGDRTDVVFHQVSTDEVFGSARPGQTFVEDDPYAPSSPYAASKAAADLLVKAYGRTYGLPCTISLGSNTFGPWQHPEKFIPRMLSAMMSGLELPLYGDGKAERDWLYVDDHAEAIWRIVGDGKAGRTYSAGGGNALSNSDMLGLLISAYSHEAGADPEKLRSRIRFVADRPAHDRRYALNCERVRAELGWQPRGDFLEAIAETVRWYISHEEWLLGVAPYERERFGGVLGQDNT